tara:strand:- start:748 stop:1491 length:744 start_codon:yes stop_codon:yes gene_type:complete
MTLAIDIGNTNIVLGIFKKNKLTATYRINSNKVEISKIDFLEKYNFKNIIISSVVPNLTNDMKQFCKKKFNLKNFIIKHNNVPNLQLDINNPAQLGTDRICNTVATISLYSLPAIVIDMGTATKYDIINSNGIFIGGIISPGIKISATILFEKAALLDKTKFEFPKQVIGKNTQSNIQSGIMYGAIDSVNGMIKRIINETKWKNYSIIITGGLSELLKSKLNQKYIFNPNLTLEGLNFINQKISKKY